MIRMKESEEQPKEKVMSAFDFYKTVERHIDNQLRAEYINSEFTWGQFNKALMSAILEEYISQPKAEAKGAEEILISNLKKAEKKIIEICEHKFTSPESRYVYKDLEEEIRTRKDRYTPMCIGCHGKWQTYYSFSPYIGEILHCHGCNKPVEKCTCTG